MKNTITKTFNVLGKYDVYKIEEFLSLINDRIDEAKRHGLTNLIIEMECESEYDGYSSFDLLLKGDRLETDEEEQIRIIREDGERIRTEEYELRKYMELKKKFEKT